MPPTPVRRTGWRGVGVALEGPPDLLDGVRAQLPPFWDDGGGEPAATVVLRREGGEVEAVLPDGLSVRGPAGAEVLRAAASRVELLVASLLPDLVAVHAGVVAVGGRALVLPGRSHAGKSTLVAALLAAGATYLSDEFALLTPDGRVAPYPRALTTRTPGGSVRTAPVGAAAADGRPLPVAVVGLLRHDPAGWSAQPAPPSRVVLGLTANALPVRTAPERSLTALVATASAATSLVGTRGEAEDAAARLLALLG